MKAIVLTKLGGANVLKAKDIPKSSIINSNDVLIKMKYSGINFAEILARRGLYKWVPAKKGFILGMEGSGVVEEVGNEVTNCKVGDPVIVARGFGCHAEYVALEEKYVFPAIPRFTLEQNAAFAGSFMTAYIALVKMARVESGETILVQAAAGALGTASVLLAKALGLKVAGTASSTEKLAVLHKLGIDLAINYSKESFKESIMEWTNNKGVNVILESVGGEIFSESLHCLSPMGRLIFVGLSSVRFSKFNPLTWWSTYKLIPKVNLLEMLGKSQGILAFHVGRLIDNNYTEIRRSFVDLVNLVQKHKIAPVIGKIFPLEAIAKAHRMIESRNNIGKILLKIDV
ncbi:MAG: quinone oxidoreductase family protein [Candidatus Hodarchaeales archaeon]|jgi:NADPH2:quinone reductase